jgi:hypothetical protein
LAEFVVAISPSLSLLSKGTKATVFTAELRKAGLPGTCEKLKGRAAGAAMVMIQFSPFQMNNVQCSAKNIFNWYRGPRIPVVCWFVRLSERFIFLVHVALQTF